MDRTPPAPAGPPLPEWADPRDLDPAVRAGLRGLDFRNAETVARHLVVAGALVDEDPEQALAHARAARDRASRIALVREAVGVAAYHAGDYAEASRELRAYRRMSGDQGYRAVLADCERAQGRPEVALRLVREALAEQPDRDETVELQLVEAGVRQDLGEVPAARLVLEGALGGRPQPDRVNWDDEPTRRLAIAYAGLLTAVDDPAAVAWQEAVAAAEPEDDDVAFGEEELPEVPDIEPVADDDDAVVADEVDVDAGVDAGDDELDFDADVEREVAELLGEVEPSAEDEPGP
ncbi:tetratricopeptide repeat protein [Geodermatophilus sp. SYSU D01036]